MPANSAPIFSARGAIGIQSTPSTLTAAMTTNLYDGTGGNVALAFTATGPNSEGGYVQRLRFKAIGTNVATVARVFLNNGSTRATATNNTLYGEVSLPAITGTATAATVDIDYPMNIALPNGWIIYVGLGTTVASGWVITTIAGGY